MQFFKNNVYRDLFVNRYGIPRDVMYRYDFYERGKSVWAFTGKNIEVDVELMGIRALRIGKSLKPTTAFIRIVGGYATRNVALLDYESSIKFLRGENVTYQSPDIEKGYIIVRNEEDVLGCGYFTGEKIISEIPKKYRLQDTWV